VHQQAEEEVNFSGIFFWVGEGWKVRVVNLAVLACVLRATTIKRMGPSSFLRKKVHPPENPGYAYVWEGDLIPSPGITLFNTPNLCVGKPSAEDQPTRPTQPFILSGSINE